MAAEIHNLHGDAGQISPPLQQGGGGGTFDNMDIVDAKIAAAEARTDAKFAEMMGELKAMRTDLSHMPSTITMIGTMGAFTGVMITVVLALFALSGQMFGIGMDAQQVSERAVQTASDRLQPKIDNLAESNRDMNAKMDAIIRGLNDRMMGSGETPAPYKP
ncbi:hypothetical protein G6L26_007540 [Agrobacterium radiobacter]|uniref:Uncharacterized protein n=1 Tax=Agrobacterium tumefaciens str. B6 TaxID=1183423 RepID=A0A822UYZ9_AGRTU|nr:hypothetical protein [Agrobacterium tumefaciens]KWT88031.1 hypothetical protein ASB65_18540 [Agrobacterium tumefaciens str. B6]MQB28171.1 hypothetical protein [Agrobacterium tumefaciens]NTA05024.1 hypothetical protein [Agrobacterium tumefaciens]NTA91619.1 hypothetical protein [Agrobacterium tumefaciens]NTB12769.1 hypothetical protein [Agrobacterium tumefaciens]